MATYTLVFTRPDGTQNTNLATFESDEMLIVDLQTAVGADVPSIAAGRGSGDTIEWLGVADWNGGNPTWTPEE